MAHHDGRSVAELRRESERTRAELTQSVEALRSQITETADGVRRTISPDNIKAEVSEYVADKGRGWLETLKQQAMDNPMQALAAGTAVAVPAMRLVRNIPLPLLMIGAGLALASPRVRRAMADKLTDATGAAPGETIDRMQDLAGEKLRAATSAAEQAAQTAQSIRNAVDGRIAEAGDAANQVASDLKHRAAQLQATASEFVSEKAAAAGDALQAAGAKSADALGAARSSAETVVRDNAVVVGGIGLAIGALLAASLPATRLERSAVGEASRNLRDKTADAAGETFDRVKSAVSAVAEDVQADVAEGVARVAEAATDKLKTVIDDAITTAFEPTQPHR